MAHEYKAKYLLGDAVWLPLIVRPAIVEIAVADFKKVDTQGRKIAHYHATLPKTPAGAFVLSTSHKQTPCGDVAGRHEGAEKKLKALGYELEFIEVRGKSSFFKLVNLNE